jgi:hypothetical protein
MATASVRRRSWRFCKTSSDAPKILACWSFQPKQIPTSTNNNIETMTLTAKDLTKEYPRSPRETLGGYVLAARVLDKCRSANYGNNSVMEFNSTGSLLDTISSPSLNDPVYVAFTPEATPEPSIAALSALGIACSLLASRMLTVKVNRSLAAGTRRPKETPSGKRQPQPGSENHFCNSRSRRLCSRASAKKGSRASRLPGR